MMIGQLAASSGLSVRTLRFYADAGVLPEAGRTAAGYRVFGPDEVGNAVGELAGPAARAGLDPASPEALGIVERLEAVGPTPTEDRLSVAARIEAFSDRRVGRYWTLVGIVNGWPADQAPEDVVDAWEWYARSLRAHA